MNDAHPILGQIDTDSPDHMIAPGFHKDARNIVFKGVRGRFRAESALGTTLIPNPYLPTGGVNLTIGNYYDDVNGQLYKFNFNSNGTSGIYIYTFATQTWQTLIVVGTNTIGDPLGFTTARIQGIRLIYGDPDDGDLLFFLNSSGVPLKMNVKTYLTAPPGNIIRQYLSVIKAPPPVPPRVVYENDTTVLVNNCTNSLFQFAYTWIDGDFEETVLSSGSIVTLPSVSPSNTVNIDKTKDARIAVYMQTGDQTVKKIRIYMRYTQNGSTSGWFIVDDIIKAGNGIPDNSVYRYEFFNGGNYIPADPNFTVLLFDQVPQNANCQELLNGNTIAYSGITEGYDWFPSQFSYNLSYDSNEDVSYIINGVLFFADYNGTTTLGQPNIQIYLTGEGTNDPVNGNVTDLANPPENYYILAQSGSTNIGFSTGTFGVAHIPTVLADIATAATAAGWQLIATNPNSIVISYPTGNVVIQSTRIENRFLDVNNPSYQLALLPQSNYALGVVYYDQYGRTNGVITDVTANINTYPYNQASDVTITNVQVNLNGIAPPTWAIYYHLVKTNTLTYNKQFYWVSNSALSNVGQLVDVQYAYIGISNITDYNEAIQATQGVVGYEFTQGDRIRFLQRIPFNGIPVSLNYDYSIIGLAVNPIINGTEQLGSFIQIVYPVADINANFKFDGSVDFNDYFFVVYSAAASASPTVANTGSSSSQGNIFYEFGQQYFIGNPGLPTAYHFGNFANNKIIFNDGDYFARLRTIPIGNTYYFDAGSAAFSNRWITPKIVPQTAGTIVTPYYTVGSQANLEGDPFNPGAYPQAGDSGGSFANTYTNNINVRYRGTISANPDGATWMDVMIKIDLAGGGSTTTPFILTHSTGIPNETSTDIVFDGTVTVPPGAKAWFMYGNGEQVENLHTNGFLLRMDVVTNVTVNIFDSSFSDLYNLRTNSNSRAIVQDTLAKQTYYSTLFRYSLAYQVGTTINNTNRFYPNNYDEFDKSHGDVIRMRSRQKELRVFQKRRTGRVGVYAMFIKDNSGNNTLITTDNIITQNNIQYFEGEFGINNQPDSLSSSGYADYFADNIKGAFLRLSENGVENITHEITQGSKVQTFAGQNLPNYLLDWTYQFGGNAVILGAYNFTEDRDSEAIFVLQGGTIGASSIPGQSLAFVEAGNRWTSFYDFAPDAIVCCENQLYSFYNGQLYAHNNETTYCNYYGTQYMPSITVVKNDNPWVKKTFMSISEISNVIWNSPLVYTDMNTYPGQRQESKLFDQYFKLLEAAYHSNFFMDLHSSGGIGNGNALKGQLIVIQLQPTNGALFSWLAEIGVKYIVSPVLAK